MNSPSILSRRNLQFLLPVALILPILAHIYNSHFTRMMSDDYCFASVAHEQGLWGSLVFWFNNWSGGHSSILGQSAVALIGTPATALLPGLLLVLWFAALVWSIYQAALLLNLHNKIGFSFLFGSLILYGTIGGIPNVYQSVYWTSGSLTYTAPMVVTTFYVGFLLFCIRQNPSRVGLMLMVLLGGIVTFIAGGFSETTVALQTFMLALALGWCWFRLHSPARSTILSLLAAGLVGAVIALVVTLAAPGNAVRESNFNVQQSMLQVGLLSLRNAAIFVSMQLAYFSLLPILICLILSAFTAVLFQPFVMKSPIQFKRVLQIMGLSAAIGFVLIVASLAPAAYGMGQMPTSRAWIVPQTLLILVVICWGLAIGLSFRQSEQPSAVARLVILALVIVGPVLLTITILSNSSALNTFASEWDQQNQSIRESVANGAANVTVSALSVNMAAYANLQGDDPTSSGDVIACMQEFYKLDSLTITRTD